MKLIPRALHGTLLIAQSNNKYLQEGTVHDNTRVLKNTKINLNNGSILEYKNGIWYKDDKYFTDYALLRYKYYDKNKKSWMKLTRTGSTKLYTPYMDKLNKLKWDVSLLRSNTAYALKFLPSLNIITLKTKGKMNLTDIPINLLDSIAINTGRSRTNIKTNLGLIGKESTFGGHSKALGIPINYAGRLFDPLYLTSNWLYRMSPYEDYLEAVDKKIQKEIKKGKDPVLANIDAEKDIKYAYKHNNIKTKTKHYSDNVFADAFARYADNPKKYNPGQGNYILMVTNIGNEVWDDPQILNWWNTEGIKYYNKGLQED